MTLELGGNAAVIVNDDADVAYAAERDRLGRLRVRRARRASPCSASSSTSASTTTFVAELLPRVEALKVGDPLDEETDVGPVIDAANAERVEEWLDEARAARRDAS